METDEKILLWRRGREAGRAFRIAVNSYTPERAAKLCGMTSISKITPDGGVSAINKLGHEIVIFEMPKGPLAVDVTDEENWGEEF